MAWHSLKALWRNFAHRESVENDLDAELRSYRELLQDELSRTGTPPHRAAREALLELGGAEQIKESVRDVRLGSSLDAIGTELRQSVRALRRSPALSLLCILMLAIGIWASTSVFSIFYATLVQPLPFRDAGSLVQLSETRLQRGIDIASFAEANFWDVRRQNRAFMEVAAQHYDETNLTGFESAEKVSTISVTSGFFKTLGVTPQLGRDFSYDEDRGGLYNGVVIVGNRFWRKRFAADPKILGRTLRLNDRSYTVVGVLPPGEPWIDDQLYVPFGYRPDANRGSWEFQVIARLKPGVTIETARSDLPRIAGILVQTYPKEDKGIGFRIDPSSTWVANPNTRRALWVLLAAVTFLLLIVCVNVANLLLARGMARQREIAIRNALGASRARLIRFVMMESLLLTVFGAALGVILASLTIRAIQTLDIHGIPRLTEANLNTPVLIFAALIAILTGIFSGLAPALQAPSSGIAAALHQGDRQTGSRGHGRLRGMLVAGEVALSVILLVGAGLLIRSFTQLNKVDLGFQTDNRLLFSVSLPNAYWEKGIGKQFLDRLFERLSATPRVEAVGAVSNRPVEGGDTGMSIDSNSRPQGSAPPWSGWRIVSPGYFKAIGLPLLRGRNFDEHDIPVWDDHGNQKHQRRVIISERLAKLIFPNLDPIGRNAILWKGQSEGPAEVIGVVGDSRERGLTADPALMVYICYGKNALTTELVVHTANNPIALVPAIHSIVASLDPNVPVADVRTFNEIVHRSVDPQRFNAILLGIFSGFALLLAITGIYGVLSYSTGRRTSEIGLRVALGANTRSILQMVIRQGMKPAFVGMGVGIIVAWWLSRYFAALLFGIKPFDLLTYGAVTALLLITALAACYLPGRRAMRTDPAVALRID